MLARKKHMTEAMSTVKFSPQGDSQTKKYDWGNMFTVKFSS